MARSQQQPKLENRKLTALKDHPLQADYFGGLPDYNLRLLAEDIRTNGLRNPIEIMPPKNRAGLPAGTIIKGHQRKRAQELNEATETAVLVRYDLVDVDATTVEVIFMEDDDQRRHDDPLTKARIALRKFEIERKRPRGGLRPWEKAEARDRVGEAIGMSGRNLQRYFSIVQGPPAVEKAYRSKQLTLVEAARIGCMPAKDQEHIAARIEAGETPKAVLASYQRQQKQGDNANQELRRLLRAHTRCQTELAGRISDLKVSVFDDRIEGEIDKASAFLGVVKIQAARCRKQGEKRLAKLGGKVHRLDNQNEGEEEE